jgi:hypothetical protein
MLNSVREKSAGTVSCQCGMERLSNEALAVQAMVLLHPKEAPLYLTGTVSRICWRFCTGTLRRRLTRSHSIVGAWSMAICQWDSKSTVWATGASSLLWWKVLEERKEFSMPTTINTPTPRCVLCYPRWAVLARRYSCLSVSSTLLDLRFSVTRKSSSRANHPPSPSRPIRAKGKDADTRRQEGSELDAKSPLRGSLLRANLQQTLTDISVAEALERAMKKRVLVMGAIAATTLPPVDGRWHSRTAPGSGRRSCRAKALTAWGQGMKLEGAHHLQNPQNRPWYRFCNRLADRPLGRVSCLQGALEAGRVGLLG